MASRTLAVADVFATALQTFLTTNTIAATVSREYVPDVDDDAFDDWIDSATPMKVYVVPLKKKTALHTRGRDLTDYSFAVIFAEKYTSAGVPTKAWMDARVGYVELAEDQFGDIRNAFDSTYGKLWAVESEVTLVFDADTMREEHAFWSVWALTLRESVGTGV